MIQKFLVDQTLPGGTLRASIGHITGFVQTALHLPSSWPQLDEMRELTRIAAMSGNPSTSLTRPQNTALTSTILVTLNYFTVANCSTPFYVLSLALLRASLQQSKLFHSITANIEQVIELVLSNSFLVLGGLARFGSDIQSDTITVLSGALPLMKGIVQALCNDHGSVIIDTFLSDNGDAVVIENLATIAKLNANSAGSVRQTFFHGIVPPTLVTLIKPCQWMQLTYDDNPSYVRSVNCIPPPTRVHSKGDFQHSHFRLVK